MDGRDLTRLPLRTRKALLPDTLDLHPPLRLTPHRNHGSRDLLDDACACGWEWFIAKRADSAYVSDDGSSSG
ncbi:hypothetical protein GCM10018966_045340 [Streptomyces yanii]